MSPTKPLQTESAAFTPNTQSIAKTIPAIINEATKTKTDELCSSFPEGHVTLVTSS